jgi:hypothetical protein
MENPSAALPLTAIRLACSVILTLLVPCVSPASAAALGTSDTMLVGMLEKGARLSAQFRELFERIERSDLIVLVDCGGITGAQGRLVFVTAVREWRYLHVRVRCQGPDLRLIALLAHELRHVVEIADAPFVRSARELARHYQEIGYEVVRGRGIRRSFETYAAQQAAERTRKQLAKAFQVVEAQATGGQGPIMPDPQ